MSPEVQQQTTSEFLNLPTSPKDAELVFLSAHGRFFCMSQNLAMVCMHCARSYTDLDSQQVNPGLLHARCLQCFSLLDHA
jgi:hypothetical protein